MKIIILDFSDDTVYVKDYDDNFIKQEEFLSKHGFNASDCQWMITKKIKLEID